jgi:imidazole glycerol phosphate synthase subunit HisF
MPHEKKYQNRTLLEHFKTLDFKNVKWTVAGKISNAVDVQKILDSGVDFVSIGTSAIFHHNFPKLVIDNPTFNPIAIPVSEDYHKKEGLGTKFITYLKRWPDFVKS